MTDLTNDGNGPAPTEQDVNYDIELESKLQDAVWRLLEAGASEADVNAVVEDAIDFFKEDEA